MTDDKGAGEGPYKIRDGFNRGVVGPGIPSGEEEYDLSPRVANMIFNEGRKAEREQCAHIAEHEAGEIPECMTGRIIAEKIRGGQDGE
jgi:hypothetical protein